MSNCNCNTLHIPKSQKTGKSFNFSIWDRFSVYENNEEKQDFVEYEKNLYACIKSIGMDGINPKEDTKDGQKAGEYWVRVVSGIKGDKGDVFVPFVSEDGTLSWKRNSNIEPEPVNVMGPRGYSLEFKWDGSVIYIKREDESIWTASPNFTSTKVYEPILDGNNLTWKIKDKTEVDIIDFGRIIGKSAYEIAVDQGFEGSKDEWIESLKGDPGSNIVLRINDNWLQWKYDFEEVVAYRNLYNFESVIKQLSLKLIEDDSYYSIRLKNREDEISIVKIPKINEEDFVKKEIFTTFANDINTKIQELTDAINWLEIDNN